MDYENEGIMRTSERIVRAVRAPGKQHQDSSAQRLSDSVAVVRDSAGWHIEKHGPQRKRLASFATEQEAEAVARGMIGKV